MNLRLKTIAFEPSSGMLSGRNWSFRGSSCRLDGITVTFWPVSGPTVFSSVQATNSRPKSSHNSFLCVVVGVVVSQHASFCAGFSEIEGQSSIWRLCFPHSNSIQFLREIGSNFFAKRCEFLQKLVLPETRFSTNLAEDFCQKILPKQALTVREFIAKSVARSLLFSAM